MSAPEPSPGQAAYEARITAKVDRMLGAAYRSRVPSWDALPDAERAEEETGAQAAIDVFLAGDSVSAESIREALAAQERPAPAGLRADLEATVRIWREESDPYPEDDAHDRARRGGIGYCAGELAQVLAQHPESQPAPELAAAMREARLYREALAQVASMAEAKGAVRQVSNIAKIARNALEGK